MLAIACLVVAAGCVPSKVTYYGRGIESGVVEKIDQANYGALQKIQVGDMVQVLIRATRSTEVDLSGEYNPFMQGNSGGGNGGRGMGYLVDRNGQIELPLVGQLTIAGLSTREAREVVRKAISTQLKDPWIDVTVLSYKVTFLGEVGREGPISINNERLTILEGIAQAGGMPPTAKFDRVWLIREENGERAYHLLDVNDKSIFQSEYYYLRNNDIVYVEPNKTKQFLGANAPYLSALGIVTGMVAIILALVR